MTETEENGDTEIGHDAIIATASAEVAFWKRLAIRVVIGAFATVAILAIVGAAALTFILGRFDDQSAILRGQQRFAMATDCDRRFQAALNDASTKATPAFLNGQQDYFARLQQYRAGLSDAQSHIDLGEPCPAIPPAPPPP